MDKSCNGAGIGIIVLLIAIVTFQYEIIAFFAANGLSGAAAISAGLAALGGGAVASEAAKLQVVLKEIVLAIQKDTSYFQQILLNINQQVSQLKSEVIKLKTANEKNKKKIKNLEESIKILEKLVKGAA